MAGSGALLLACSSVRAPVAADLPPAAPPHTTVLSLAAPANRDDEFFAAAARYNAVSEFDLLFSPFGRPETGWAVYEPMIAQAMGVDDAPDSDGFASAIARWQATHGLAPSGALTAETFQTFKGVWQENRPFVMLRLAEVCPDAPPSTALETLHPEEIFGDKVVMLRAAALAALRRMTAAARQEVSETAGDPDLLKVFSGYRDPAEDAARCRAEHNCQGLVRAACSAHRTGLALDLNVGFAPGFMADASDDSNRLYQSRTATYRWLVRHAAGFGFVNYAFEPWHWEWTGEAP